MVQANDPVVSLDWLYSKSAPALNDRLTLNVAAVFRLSFSFRWPVPMPPGPIRATGIGGLASDLNADLLDAAYGNMAISFDRTYGGSKGAPKFPQPMNLEFLLRNYARTGNRAALDHLMFTLRQMARGGIYDQIGGGFALPRLLKDYAPLAATLILGIVHLRLRATRA